MENTPIVQPPKLLDQIRNKLRVKHYAIRPEEQYLHWIKRYILFHGKRHPKDMGAVQIEAFLTNLAVAGKVLLPCWRRRCRRVLPRPKISRRNFRRC